MANRVSADNRPMTSHQSPHSGTMPMEHHHRSRSRCSFKAPPKDSSRIKVLSTSDGPLVTLSPEKNGQGRTIQLLSAIDGWVTIDPDSSSASTFSKNGSPAESLILKGSTASLLIKDGQHSSLSQFKAAYESGDTSWADIDFTCTDATHCSLHGDPSTLSDDVVTWNTPARAQFQSSWKLNTDKRTLTIRGRSASIEIGAVLMIDTASKTPMSPLPCPSHPVTQSSLSGARISLSRSTAPHWSATHRSPGDTTAFRTVRWRMTGVMQQR